MIESNGLEVVVIVYGYLRTILNSFLRRNEKLSGTSPL